MENPCDKLLKSLIEGAMLYYQQELEFKLNNSTTEEKETISNE